MAVELLATGCHRLVRAVGVSPPGGVHPPAAILLASDMVLNAHFGAPLLTAEMLARYVTLFLVALTGLRPRDCRHIKVFLLASVAGLTAFYFITNTASWLNDPGYAKAIAGLGQAHTQMAMSAW